MMIRAYITTEIPRAILKKELDVISGQVNEILAPIHDAVIKHKGEVEIFESASGRKLITAFCDDIAIRKQMQDLLDSGMTP